MLIHLACQNHLNNIYCLFVGIAQSVYKAALLADTFEHIGYFRSAAVNKHNIYSDGTKKNYVGHYGILKLFVYHGISAVLYDDRFILIFLNIR